MTALRIGAWAAAPQSNELVDGARRVKIDARAMDVLCALAARPGEVVSKDALIEQVWKHRSVTDHAVTVAISSLRNALGDDPKAPRYIETVPKRGYRLIAETGASADATAFAQARTPGAGAARGAARRPPLWMAAAVLLIAATASLLLAVALSPEDPHTVSVLVAETQNGTGRPAYDAIAAATTVIGNDVLRRKDGLAAISWRDGSDRAPPSADWRLETTIIDPSSGPALALALIGRGGEIVWTGSRAIAADRYIEPHKELLAEAAARMGVGPLPLRDGASRAEAEALYWRARLVWEQRSREGALQAQALLGEALAIDPEFARAHAALADLYAHKTGAFFKDQIADPLAEAENHLAAALRASPDLFEARLAAAHIALFGRGDAADASEKLAELVRERPHHPLTVKSYATALAATGEMARAAELIAEAQRLDPFNPATAWDRVWILYMARRHDRAFEAIEAAERLGGPGALYRGLLYADLGRDSEAIDAFGRAIPGAMAARPHDAPAADRYRALANALSGAGGNSRMLIFRAILLALAGDEPRAKFLLANANPETQIWAQLWADKLPAFLPAGNATTSGDN